MGKPFASIITPDGVLTDFTLDGPFSSLLYATIGNTTMTPVAGVDGFLAVDATAGTIQFGTAPEALGPIIVWAVDTTTASIAGILSATIDTGDGTTITLRRGEARTDRIFIMDGEGEPIDLTGATVTIQVKAALRDEYPDLILKSTDDSDDAEIVIPQTGDTLGGCDIHWLAADTNGDIEYPRTYPYIGWATLTDGNIVPFKAGTLVLLGR